MKPLTIELTKGAARQLQSIGWKTPRADDCRRHFFALDMDNKPLVVTLKPAMPRFLVPGSSVIFSREPFPEAVCVEISPCRLLAPPCYQTQEELDGVFPGLRTFDPWQWVYWKTHRQFLILEPADDGVLQKRLDKWLTLGFSKKLEHLKHSVALSIAHYNFCRVHHSLQGETPAMAARLTDHVWTIAELLTESGQIGSEKWICPLDERTVSPPIRILKAA